MAAAAYFQPAFVQASWGLNKNIEMLTDTLNVGLIATTGLAARATSEGYQFVSQLLANGGSALTEVSGGGYSRQALTSVTWSTSGLVVTFSASNPSWASATWTAYYAWIHDETASSGTDATRPLLCIYDFGGAQPVSAATFTLAVNASGLATATMAA
jgi:hypothetical protein